LALEVREKFPAAVEFSSADRPIASPRIAISGSESSASAITASASRIPIALSHSDTAFSGGYQNTLL
jgi:hypothetical protein